MISQNLLSYGLIQSALVPFAILLFAFNVASAAERQNCSAVSQQTCDVAHKLGKGINLGNMLDAPREGDWGVNVEPEFFDLVAEKFDTVRIPIRWSNHASTSQLAIIDEAFFQRVEMIIDKYLARERYVIINMHHYNQLFGDKLNPNEFSVDESVVQARFLSMWKQISLRFKDKSDKLIFEILNEPHGKLENRAWYDLMNQALAVIRVENPNRVIMIAPSGNRYESLDELANVLSNGYDKNVILAFHNYAPFPYTHQGTSWMPWFPKGVSCCSPEQKNLMKTQLMKAIDWNKRFGIPVHLGEFGANNQSSDKDRATYNKEVVSLMNRYSVGWTYWELASSFGIYNPKSREWNQLLLDSLLIK